MYEALTASAQDVGISDAKLRQQLMDEYGVDVLTAPRGFGEPSSEEKLQGMLEQLAVMMQENNIGADELGNMKTEDVLKKMGM